MDCAAAPEQALIGLEPEGPVRRARLAGAGVPASAAADAPFEAADAVERERLAPALDALVGGAEDLLVMGAQHVFDASRVDPGRRSDAARELPLG